MSGLPAPRRATDGSTGRGAGGLDRVPLVPRATLAETARVLTAVVAPLVARGVILPRPAALAVADRRDADRRVYRVLAALRARYHGGPVRLAAPLGRFALPLSPDHARRVLAGSPEPFAPATREKRAALAHFQPHGVLISTGEQRPVRRRLNETVLDTPSPVHRLGDTFARKVADEAAALGDTLTWAGFHRVAGRIVRRVVLGDAAADDTRFTAVLDQLRDRANWAYLRPRRERLRHEFTARLAGYAARAEPDSLMAVLAKTPAPPGADPVGQAPQWLFAFDSAAVATYRALAVLAAHPEALERARAEAAGDRLYRPYLRACVLDAVRLWPTTQAILRDSLAETLWPAGRLPAGTSLLIISSYFHRDPATVPFADRFTPEAWLDGRAASSGALIPFSDGPGRCPGRNLVLLVAGTLLAEVIRDRRPVPAGGRRLFPEHLPATLDHTALRLRLEPAPREISAAPQGPR
ncbi:cytochrome P450 [Rhizomonospora bruguierae]|uniref:cytochrome P450 n=1 Tax=Rhizomonospora bruguierae TaxID=1581705 RepID=UPI001BD01DB2|nr:cytochrome P450 [Micromonospora sp. NBRC 107566]